MSAGEMLSASTRGPSSARPNAPTCLPAYCARLRDRRQAPASLVHMLHLCDTYACAINLQSNKLFPTRPAGRVSSVITEVVAVGLRRCQHGPRECDLNRVLNCAQQLSSNQASARGRPPRPSPFQLHHSARPGAVRGEAAVPESLAACWAPVLSVSGLSPGVDLHRLGWAAQLGQVARFPCAGAEHTQCLRAPRRRCAVQGAFALTLSHVPHRARRLCPDTETCVPLRVVQGACFLMLSHMLRHAVQGAAILTLSHVPRLRCAGRLLPLPCVRGGRPVRRPAGRGPAAARVRGHGAPERDSGR